MSCQVRICRFNIISSSLRQVAGRMYRVRSPAPSLATCLLASGSPFVSGSVIWRQVSSNQRVPKLPGIEYILYSGTQVTSRKPS